MLGLRSTGALELLGPRHCLLDRVDNKYKTLAEAVVGFSVRIVIVEEAESQCRGGDIKNSAVVLVCKVSIGSDSEVGELWSFALLIGQC